MLELEIQRVASYFKWTYRRPSARLRRALAGGNASRIRHHFDDHKRRVAKLDACAARLFARNGQVHPFSIGAVLTFKAKGE